MGSKRGRKKAEDASETSIHRIFQPNKEDMHHRVQPSHAVQARRKRLANNSELSSKQSSNNLQPRPRTLNPKEDILEKPHRNLQRSPNRKIERYTNQLLDSVRDRKIPLAEYYRFWGFQFCPTIPGRERWCGESSSKFGKDRLLRRRSVEDGAVYHILNDGIVSITVTGFKREQ